ncbi:hypothetical protein GCM10010981_11680 [Dyella nitratireducens]|uniref:Uncharacterized protein n=1 Tax=Dyella nitratireducens TaxID=1849580 RepID=A0ABQ1FQZ2_9GAMM|nr:hypothetical protein GCM10010981_11680 [Dyella nitratireducens]GLQ43770.1 hypothetical protein GCM10007902_36200 [Dyella nitratireducens]
MRNFPLGRWPGHALLCLGRRISAKADDAYSNKNKDEAEKSRKTSVHGAPYWRVSALAPVDARLAQRELHSAAKANDLACRRIIVMAPIYVNIVTLSG